MDYSQTIPDGENRQILATVATQAASIAGTVEKQPTLNPSQRQAVANLKEAAAKVKELFSQA
jgi:hypothetical protein